MSTEMTITEGLKRLGLIKKRMTKNCKEIATYSSLLSTEKPLFASEDEQRKEVAQLVQSNLDLQEEYLNLKSMIDYSNLMVVVQIGGVSRTISQWLTILNKTGKEIISTYKSLNESAATSRQVRMRGDSNPTITRLYDENDKRNGQKKWEDLTEGVITSRLEVINATTKIMKMPTV